MRYFCTDCGYIYDEAIGDEDIDTSPGTKLENIDDFYCPHCEADIDMFQPIVEEVMYAENPGCLSTLEKEHIPKILHMDQKEIEVSVGEEIHPMGDDHRITSIELYDEYGDLIEEHFFDIDEDPVFVFHTEDLDAFEIRAVCNQHGVWSTGIIENKDFDS